MPPAFEEDTGDLRKTLESAIQEVEEDDPEVSLDTGVATDAPAPLDEASPAPADTAPAPVEAEAAPAPTDTPTPTPAPNAPIDADPLAKPPGSWTPVAREKWGNLAPEVRQEVWKREREASRALTLSADARKFQESFERTIHPYMGFIAAEGSNPLQAVNFMMQTAAILRVGTKEQKVETVANVIRQYGIDLEALDMVLAGHQQRVDPQTVIQREVQQALAPVMQQIQQSRQAQEAQVDQAVNHELDKFIGDPAHEFYWDVKDVMADLIEVASRRGQQMGLTEAYERAILLHDPVRRVIEGRKQTEAANIANQRARRAKGAAVSVTPSSEVQTATALPGDSLRSAIEFAIANSEGR